MATMLGGPAAAARDAPHSWTRRRGSGGKPRYAAAAGGGGGAAAAGGVAGSGGGEVAASGAGAGAAAVCSGAGGTGGGSGGGGTAGSSGNLLLHLSCSRDSSTAVGSGDTSSSVSAASYARDFKAAFHVAGGDSGGAGGSAAGGGAGGAVFVDDGGDGVGALPAPVAALAKSSSADNGGGFTDRLDAAAAAAGSCAETGSVASATSDDRVSFCASVAATTDSRASFNGGGGAGGVAGTGASRYAIAAPAANYKKLECAGTGTLQARGPGTVRASQAAAAELSAAMHARTPVGFATARCVGGRVAPVAAAAASRPCSQPDYPAAAALLQHASLEGPADRSNSARHALQDAKNAVWRTVMYPAPAAGAGEGGVAPPASGPFFRRPATQRSADLQWASRILAKNAAAPPPPARAGTLTHRPGTMAVVQDCMNNHRPLISPEKRSPRAKYWPPLLPPATVKDATSGGTAGSTTAVITRTRRCAPAPAPAPAPVFLPPDPADGGSAATRAACAASPAATAGGLEAGALDPAGVARDSAPRSMARNVARTGPLLLMDAQLRKTVAAYPGLFHLAPTQSVFTEWEAVAPLGSGTFASVMKVQRRARGRGSVSSTASTRASVSSDAHSSDGAAGAGGGNGGLGGVVVGGGIDPGGDEGKVPRNSGEGWFAAKLLEPQRFRESTQARVAEMFAKEIEYWAAAGGCPGVVPVRQVVRGVEGWLVVSQLIRGGTLWDDFQCGSAAERFSLFAQLLQTLQYVQERGIVHRDLKPTNILRSACRSRLWVTDFGWSEAVGALNRHPSELPGTVEINPPEIHMHQRQSEKVDNYALAMNMLLLYAESFVCRDRMCGSASLAASRVLETVAAIRAGPIPGNFTPDAWQLFLGLSAFNPERRMSLAEVFASPWFRSQVREHAGYFRELEAATGFRALWHPAVFNPDNQRPAWLSRPSTARSVLPPIPAPLLAPPPPSRRGPAPPPQDTAAEHTQPAQPVRSRAVHILHAPQPPQPPPLPPPLSARSRCEGGSGRRKPFMATRAAIQVPQLPDLVRSERAFVRLVRQGPPAAAPPTISRVRRELGGGTAVCGVLASGAGERRIS